MNRRTFLRTTAAGSSLLLLRSGVLNGADAPSNQLNIALNGSIQRPEVLDRDPLQIRDYDTDGPSGLQYPEAFVQKGLRLIRSQVFEDVRAIADVDRIGFERQPGANIVSSDLGRSRLEV